LNLFNQQSKSDKMVRISSLTRFASFMALLGPALAGSKLYRMHSKGPAVIKEAGGIVAHNPEGTGTIIEHVLHPDEQQDPWVSASSSQSFIVKAAKQSNYDNYVYTFDARTPYKLKIADTDKEFKNAKLEHPHPGESEYAVHGYIPWDSIISWEVYNRGKLVEKGIREDLDRRSKSPKYKGRSIR
jgi:hypothetical protein